MAARRIIYLLVWISCLVFFWAYQQWLAWYALVAVTCLPLFSLLVSLPAMLTARLDAFLPDGINAGTPLTLVLRCGSDIPTPPWRCRVLAERPITGERWMLKAGKPLPTEHCGTLFLTFKGAKVCDYLGLFNLPLKCPRQKKLPVRPAPIAVEEIPELNRNLGRGWQPKRGGGFSENHELRLYQPGDSIQQIHWKLSSKTGKLILREPMEPVRRRMLLRLDLNGTPRELDRKLGRLLWLGNRLLDMNIHFEIQCLTGTGRELRSVTGSEELRQAVDALLDCPRTESGSIRDWAESAAWQYYIGGGADEA